MKSTNLLSRLLFLSVVIAACTEDNDVAPLQGDFENGIIISAEGNFGGKDGSVAFLDGDLSKKATNFIYTSVNNAQLGGLVQSIGFSEEDAFIIINDAHSIAVVDRTTFEKKTIVLEGLKNPRYMVVEGGKGYVTNWGEGGDPSDDYIAVLDLESYAVESTISLKNGVEQIAAKEGKLYVSHKGAFTTNNIISVVDIATNEVVEIEVGDNPDEIIFDATGDLYVLFEGRSIWNSDWTAIESHTEAGIAKIDTNTNTVVRTLTFDLGAHPGLFSLENDNLYYALNGSVFSMTASDTSLPTTALLETGSIYGMTVKNGQLYTLKRAFENLSQLNVIDINSGQTIHSSAVGLGASKIYFN